MPRDNVEGHREGWGRPYLTEFINPLESFFCLYFVCLPISLFPLQNKTSKPKSRSEGDLMIVILYPCWSSLSLFYCLECWKLQFWLWICPFLISVLPVFASCTLKLWCLVHTHLGLLGLGEFTLLLLWSLFICGKSLCVQKFTSSDTNIAIPSFFWLILVHYTFS